MQTATAHTTDTGDCVHEGFAGMRRDSVTDAAVRYVCGRCGSTYDAPRCVAITVGGRSNRPGGTRCKQIASRFHTTCYWHDDPGSDGTGGETSASAGPDPSRSEELR